MPDAGAGGRRTRLGDSWLLPCLVTLLVACAFVGVRLAWVGSGDVGRFVVAGARVTDLHDSGLPVVRGPGYDGQMFFRLAVDPLDFSHRSGGVSIDNRARFQRITYPVVAYVLAAGDRSAVPWTLVVANVLALAALGAMGGAIARACGRHVLWGLLLPGYFGFVFAVSRDLSEVVEVAFLVGGLLALRKHRPWLGAGLLAAAVLTRETALLAVAGIALWRLFEIVTRRDRPRAFDASWLVPPVVFGAWQVYVAGDIGRYPASSSTGSFEAPGAALAHAAGTMADWFPHVNLIRAVHVVEVVVLLGVGILALLSIGSTDAPPYERAAFVCLLVAALSIDTSEGIWSSLHDFRMFGDLYALAVLLILGSRRRLVVPALAVGLCTVGAMASSARFL